MSFIASTYRKTRSALQGEGFVDPKAEQVRLERERKAQIKEQKKQASFKDFQEKVRREELADRAMDAQAKKEGAVVRTLYKPYAKARDFGQYVARGTKLAGRAVKYGDDSEADTLSFSKTKLGRVVDERIGRGGVTGKVLQTARLPVSVYEGGVRSVPFVPELSYTKENLKENPAVLAGQIGGGLLVWRGAGLATGKVIGSTGKLTRAVKTAPAVLKPVYKAGELGARATTKVIASKPVRLASEGYTGEVVDVGQAYFKQRGEIGQAVARGDFKEAGLRLGAGYVVEKAEDKAVGAGFRSALPRKTVDGKQVADVETFISESGTDPTISRLFKIQPEKKTFADRIDDYTGIDFRSPDTRIDPRVLEGTKPLGRGEWDLSGYAVRGTKTDNIKDIRQRLEKMEKAEKQEKQEKQEKLEKLQRLDKVPKTKIFEPFAMPIGQTPSGFGFKPLGPMIRSRTFEAKIRDLSKEQSMPKQNFNFQKKPTFESSKKINQMLGMKKKTNWRF